MSVKIRPATPDDYERLEALSEQCGKDPKWDNFVPDTTEDTYKPLQQIDPNLVLKAEIDDKIVAYLTSDEYNKDEKTVAIETVFVQKAYRRQGIATELVDYFCAKWIGEEGFKLHLYAIDEDSFEIFTKLGWTLKWANMEKSEYSPQSDEINEVATIKSLLPYFIISILLMSLPMLGVLLTDLLLAEKFLLSLVFVIFAVILAPMIKLRVDMYTTYFGDE